jgi:hypothetical protein
VFLTSPTSDFILGAVIPVDAGFHYGLASAPTFPALRVGSLPRPWCGRGPSSLRLNAPIAAVSVACVRCPPSEAAGAGFTDSSRRCRGYWSLTKMLSHPQAPSFTQPLGRFAALCRTSKTPLHEFPLE